MVIEWLKIQVDPALREAFVQKDNEIWTKQLSQQPGHLSKEVWIDPIHADIVVLISRWATREAWKAVPAQELEATEKRFVQAIGEGVHKIIEAGEYQVRKFPQARS
ncbi:TIGR03792 family protein [Phormidium sp. FACHB-592]|uniref:TIGR03792 family protein n=1 Tax=Stenomitos frigidus AS-A4 TaxID=2933935 RepID=A0ABV0KDT2_9CYAN|nr:TIGR03792 family protein [Phormidium sp. FACHB-592]MBD2077848.1 TIGR03792 family protein [Phormidium sp. FACHB-592]